MNQMIKCRQCKAKLARYKEDIENYREQCVLRLSCNLHKIDTTTLPVRYDPLIYDLIEYPNPYELHIFNLLHREEILS